MSRHLAPLAAALVACALALGACVHPDLAVGALTPDGDDSYDIDLDEATGTMTASAPETNTRGNLRWAFWRKADAPRLDQQICTTWVDGDISTTQQQGAALQIRREGSRTRAITVTRHIFNGFGGQFNLHTMDSQDPVTGAPKLTWFGGVIITSLADETTPYPWRLCARIVGRTVSFIVWPLGQPQPAWGTPGAGGSTVLPEGWDAASGIPGFYVGHLTAGESVGFTDVAITAQ